MTDWAIETLGVSKLYRRGLVGASTLREELAGWFSGRREQQPPERSSFYALKDVSFTVPKGVVLGLIGPNGSGKTTLMKVLASITEPTEGEVRLRGRVGSLLAVGAGFDPEVDGLENILLNGAILGMSRAEIGRKLDRIIAFADIGPVMETPVKRYSSGMYVRLAFAIAAHLDAEILLVDEVLAVGDADFQRKSLNAIREAAKGGRTVLFVSHNMATVNQVCDLGLYLDSGRVRDKGDLAHVTETYMNRVSLHQGVAAPVAAGGVSAEIRFLDQAGEPCNRLRFGGDYDLELAIRSTQPLRRLNAEVTIRGEDGALISTLGAAQEGLDGFDLDRACALVFRLRSLGLMPGAYYAGLSIGTIGDEQPLLAADAVRAFDVVPARVNDAAEVYGSRHGLVRIAELAELRRL